MSNPMIAIVELNSQRDILSNLQVIEQAVALACHHKADFVVLPENAFCFGDQAHAAQFFEPLTAWCSQLAQQYQIHLLAGTLPCAYRPDGSKVADGKFRQSSLLFDPAGDCLARYDKIHLFKATVNDSTGSYDESKTFEAGNREVVVKTALGTMGMMVCFDIRFAPLALRLRDMGAQILTAPSAFTYQTGKAHWQSLLTARALDSQCLIIGAGQTGKHYLNTAKSVTNDSLHNKIHNKTTDTQTYRETWGHSQFVNANGEILGTDVPLFEVDFTQKTALIHAAQSWLPTPVSSDSMKLPSNNRVILTCFDNDKQEHWRQAIDLSAAQQYVTEPLVKQI